MIHWTASLIAFFFGACLGAVIMMLAVSASDRDGDDQ